MKYKNVVQSSRALYEEALLSRHNLADILLAFPDTEPVRTKLDDYEVIEVGDLTLIRIEMDNGVTDLEESERLHSLTAKQSFAVYKQLFQIREKYQLKNLVRIWNYIPYIVDHVDEPIPLQDRERYRQFNAGRMLAWDLFGVKSGGENIYPAATGIGTHNDSIVIEALFSPHPVIYLDNDLQDPAYNYPSHYGSVRPAFSRATLHLPPDQQQIFISGTGSILRSKTVNVGNIGAQARQVLDNINYLISDANMSRYKDKLADLGAQYSYNLHDITHLRVYMRHHSYINTVKEVVDSCLEPTQRVTYERSDFCRTDLALEMEAVIFKKR